MKSTVNLDVAHQELELLTGKIFEGDATGILFMLLRDNKHKESVIKELQKVVEEKGDISLDVSCEQFITPTRTERSAGFSLDDLFQRGSTINPV